MRTTVVVLGAVYLVGATTAGCGGSSSTESTDSGGTATGGAAVSGGTDVPGGGGTTATAGTGGASGGTAGSSGGSGTGGASPDLEVGTLGEPCTPVGALACAGNAQKLTVLCGANGTWEPNLTCGTNEYCDSRSGPTAGTCLPVDPLCVDETPGAQVCDGDQLLECGPDLVSSTVLEECSVDVCGAMCPVPCPTGEFINCDPDCGELNQACPEWGCVYSGVGVDPTLDLTELQGDTVLRVPAADTLCLCGFSTNVQAFAILRLPTGAGVEVEQPWGLLLAEGRDDCSGAFSQCIVASEQLTGDLVAAAPEDAPGANLRIHVGGYQCPE